MRYLLILQSKVLHISATSANWPLKIHGQWPRPQLAFWAFPTRTSARTQESVILVSCGPKGRKATTIVQCQHVLLPKVESKAVFATCQTNWRTCPRMPGMPSIMNFVSPSIYRGKFWLTVVFLCRYFRQYQEMLLGLFHSTEPKNCSINRWLFHGHQTGGRNDQFGVLVRGRDRSHENLPQELGQKLGCDISKVERS